MRRELTSDELICRLVEQHSDHLLRICYVYLRNTASARDAVQETFLRAIQSPKTYQLTSQDTERAWLARIAINICKDYLRSAWHRHIDYSKNLEAIASVQEDPSDHGVLSLVMLLPLKQREVTLAYYYQELSMEEIGKQLNISKATVHYRLKQAQHTLRQYWGGGEVDE